MPTAPTPGVPMARKKSPAAEPEPPAEFGNARLFKEDTDKLAEMADNDEKGRNVAQLFREMLGDALDATHAEFMLAAIEKRQKELTEIRARLGGGKQKSRG